MLIVVTLGISSFIIFEFAELSIIDSEIQNMSNLIKFKEFEIQNLHKQASEDLIFTTQNSIFVEYFKLFETQSGNVYDEHGVMQFTSEQRVIKNKLEPWIYNFQNKFSVDETCLIDGTGQEHTRLVFQEIASDDELSSEEELSLFFEPSFLLEKGEIHLQYPYVSPDSKRWVFSYTTPIVMDDDSKPGFLHFEMPINVFQELVNVDTGRMYVVDPNGFIIADSDNLSVANSKYIVSPETIIDFDPQKYFPSIKLAHASVEYDNVLQAMQTSIEGSSTYSENGEEQYVVYKKLSTFDWIIVYEKPYSLMLVGDTSLNDLRTIMLIVALSMSVAGLLAVIVFSSTITKPIKQLVNQCNQQDHNHLKKINISTKDEFADISFAINDMIDQINHSRRKELSVERVSSIGNLASRLAHDMRNPLSVIRLTLENLKLLYGLDNSKEKQFEKIDRSIERMTHQIDHVLDFVRDTPLKLDKVKISKILINSLDSIKIPKNIRLVLPKNDAELICDQEKISILISNLVLNSIQSINGKGLIAISLEKKDDVIILEVEDSGKGIPEDIIEKIFDPLFTTKQVGTGLGLSSCQNIIEAHGGKIFVTSSPTIFTITLPKIN